MARLPFDTRDLQGRFIDLRRDGNPVDFQHRNRDIDDEMRNIVYNTIDVIQERARDNEMRTFYYNMMSDRNWDNKDFDNLVSLVADLIDIAVQEGQFRDARDAVVACTEEMVTLHVAFQTEEYPELMNYVPRTQERDIDRAVRTFERYRSAIENYRRNGNRIPRGGRDDDDRGRDRDRGRGANYGSERDGRRDRWNRGAVRDSVHGSPRNSTRENRFGNTDQSDRFDDPRDQGRNERREDRDNRSNDGRYGDAIEGSNTSRRAVVQRLPGSRSGDSDVQDALNRENETTRQGSNMNQNEIDVRNQVSGTDNPTLIAFENQDAWVPSLEQPHPLVFNHTQDLFYELDRTTFAVTPRVVDKASILNYYDHTSMAFGQVPKDFTRFEDGGVSARLNDLHDKLLTPTEEFTVEGSDQTVVYHRKLDLTEHNFLSYGLKDVMVRLNYRRFAHERNQPQDDKYYAVDLAVGRSMIIESFIATSDEAGLLEELRKIGSLTKLSEKMKQLAKKLRPELFLQLDAYVTQAINRMLRQNLSIPSLRITSFTSDWLELFSHLTQEYGDGYRDAINRHQEREIRLLLGFQTDAELYVMSQLPENQSDIKPFVVGMPTKVICINEVGYNLDVDMVPGVASQLLPEVNPFFHDLTQELLTQNGGEYGRFFIQTADLRVIEASRSFINENAVLLRMIK